MPRLLLGKRRRPRPFTRPQVEVLDARVLLATIVVTGTGDTIANDGVVTLREAITAANTNAASGDAGAGDTGMDTIDFSIPGTGVETITLTSDLPTITEPLTIDGYTQPGSSPNSNPISAGLNTVPLVELSPSVLTSGNGLVIAAGGSTVRGLVIGGFQYGITLQTNGGNTLAGNFIGTDPTGTVAVKNLVGIHLNRDSPSNTIGGLNPGDRNLISGNNDDGINGDGGWAGLVIEGNLIGTDITGTNALGNFQGVNLEVLSTDVTSNVTLGGTTAGARNLISGNSNGVTINGGPVGALIQGNFMGTDVTGTTKLGNNGVALTLQLGHDNTVGGTAAGAGNVLAGSGGVGFDISSSNNNLIQGNFIGTDVTGTINLGNFGGGMGASGNDNTIGGTVAHAGNTVAFNAIGYYAPQGGVYIGGTGNRILANSIFGNNGQGIIATTPAAPGLTAATNSSITGTLRGPADTTFRLEFFATPGERDQGKTFLGAMDVPIDGTGNATFTFSQPGGIPADQFLTATATSTGGTSAFSQAITRPATTSADLEVSISGSPDPIAPGALLFYTVTVTDGGPDDSLDDTLTVPIPAGTMFYSFSPNSVWTITSPAVGNAGGTITGTLSGLGMIEGPVSFTFIVTVAPGAADGSIISASASVASATTDDPDDSNNTGGTTTTVHVAAPARADAGVTVSAAPDPVAPGALLAYTITVTNDGPDVAAGLDLEDNIPAGTTFDSFTAPAGWTVSTPAAGGTGSVSAAADALPDGAYAVFTLVVRVDAGAADGATIADSASISTGPSIDNDPDNDIDTATTTIAAAPPAAADLVVTQSASPGTAIVGRDAVTFTITVTNRGPSSASSARLTETLPGAATFVSATGGITPGDGKLVFPLGDMAVGATRTFSVIVRPQVAVILTASATVSATEADPSMANNTATASAVTADPVITPPPPTDTTDGPRIVAVRRFGIHAMPTTVVIAFDRPLGASALNVENYRITDHGGARVAARSAVYDAAAHTVTLHMSRRISIHRTYKLVIRGTSPDGLSDAASRLIDGQGTGRPGSDYATTLTWRNLILPAWYRSARTSFSRGH
jgi:uncharacterized repeat protein (TIGR01451 family)